MISIKLLCNFIEMTLQNECSSVNLLLFFRTPIYKNISGGLLRSLTFYFFLFLGKPLKVPRIIFWCQNFRNSHCLRSTLKSDSHLPKKILFICFNERPSKMIKNAFYFILKVFSFSRYLHFCLDILVRQKKWLIREIRLISKFLTSQPG